MAKTLMLVDGNYLFFLCRTLGVSQDFSLLEKSLEAEVGPIDRKVFYTRPPKHDSAKPVLTWLRSHGWETHLYRYEQVSQDVLYNAMVVEIMDAAYQEAEPITVLVVSGSGTLIPALSRLKDRSNIKVVMVCTEDSTSQIVKNMPHIGRLDLGAVMNANA